MTSKKIKRLEEELKKVRVKNVVRYIKKYGVYDRQTKSYTHVVDENLGSLLRTDRPMSDVSTIVYQASKVLPEEFLDKCVIINHKYDGSTTSLSYLLEQVHKYFCCLDDYKRTPVRVCVSFTAEIVLTGKDIKDVKEKLERMPIFTKTAKKCECGITGVESVSSVTDYDFFDEEWNEVCDEDDIFRIQG